MKDTTQKLCFQCNSPLILVSSETTQINNSQMTQVTTVYRCSNQECQDEKDKKTAQRIKQYREREEALQKRAAQKAQTTHTISK